MTDRGLKEVNNPSAAMLSGHPSDAPGNCIACTMEGSRPILAEVQSLVSKTSFGTPRRTSNGIDYNRMVILMAILEKRVGLYLSGSDAYLNVIGGMRLDEPAVDLPIALAVASSYRDQPIPEGLMSFGEVGLTGELRAVSAAEQRIQEAVRLGFHTCIMPKQDLGYLNIPRDFQVVQVKNIAQAIAAAFAQKNE
jgi:DNA repair protein RadA/Sms